MMDIERTCPISQMEECGDRSGGKIIFIVTELKKLDEKRYCLYVDEEPFGPVYASDIKRLKLEVGAEADKGRLLQFRDEYFYRRAMNKAVSMLQYSEKCEYDIRKKLNDLSYDSEVVDCTVNKLKEYGYLDDSRYAAAYIRSHIQRKSRREITSLLTAKRIPEEIVLHAFEECELPDEETVIHNMLSKKYTKEDLQLKRERAVMYFVRKGYAYKQVSDCIDAILFQ